MLLWWGIVFTCGLSSLAFADTGVSSVQERSCDNARCRPLSCRDSFTPPWECCPVCRHDRSCYYKGKVYRDRERFREKCNNCVCSDGAVLCSEINCPDKPGVCPRRTIGSCVDLCFWDYDCPGEQKCCSNGCGHVCSIPQDPDTVCFVNGVYYYEGERVPPRSSHPCEACYCRGGSVTCQMIVCPVCDGPTHPGECCPRCD
ncbi:kielin/chordin-like protein isoform X2 [Dreissena polymorpha]|uniref:VWFC domain-containing protein n=2 Tax=Dreissena polymorpha TaxID=45954 RepID=A0A9D4CBG7_DREPO|nr:kielin/chordin-like protein isoform X2 [Dreissena polymorpha]KAH3720805.1 hypothetical protein DPMN_063710 [Dreissena polymorpha]